MSKKLSLKFLCDHNVPDAVGRVLVQLGHDVVRVKDIMAINAADPIVAIAAIEAARILVSWDRDFNQQRFLSPRFDKLSRIGMSCLEPNGVVRIQQVIDIIEFLVERNSTKAIRILISSDKFLAKC